MVLTVSAYTYAQTTLYFQALLQRSTSVSHNQGSGKGLHEKCRRQAFVISSMLRDPE